MGLYFWIGIRSQSDLSVYYVLNSRNEPLCTYHARKMHNWSWLGVQGTIQAGMVLIEAKST